MKFTKLKAGKYNLFLTEQELEDLMSVFSMAIRVVDKEHRDSPEFRRAIHKMNRVLWKQQKGYAG